MIKIVIPYPPVAKGRPKFTRQGFAYTPKKTRDYEKLVKTIALQHRPKELWLGPLFLSASFHCPIPESFSKKKKQLAIEGKLRPASRPDLSNYVKAVEDALNGVIYKDDSQIVDESLEKLYSSHPRVEIYIEEIDEK